MTTSDTHRKLQDLYDQVPALACKGLCWNSCGPIDMSDAERERISARGVSIPASTQDERDRWANNEPLYCPAFSLGALGEGKPGCTVHDVRPMVCRLWGTVEEPSTMGCPYGCEGPKITDTDALELLIEAMRAGGHPDMTDDQMDLLRDPEVQAVMSEFMTNPNDPDVRLKAFNLIDRKRT